MNEIKVLLREKQKININGKIIEIGTLSLRQVFKVCDFFNGDILQKLRVITWTKDNTSDFFKLLSSLSEDDCKKFIGILINIEDNEILELIINDVNVLSSIIKIFTECNDISELFQNFQATLKNISIKKEVSLTS